LVLLILSLTSELDGFLSTFNLRTFLITTLDGGKEAAVKTWFKEDEGKLRSPRRK
jgi:hypothetical protein